MCSETIKKILTLVFLMEIKYEKNVKFAYITIKINVELICNKKDKIMKNKYLAWLFIFKSSSKPFSNFLHFYNQKAR